MIENIWLGCEDGFKTYLSRVTQFEEKILPQLDLKSSFDRYGNNPVIVQKAGEYALIRIKGDTVKETSMMSRWFGMPSYEDMAESIIDVEGDPDIKRAVFIIDSYGGQAAGVKRLANKIASMKKETIAFTSETQKSAAMWYGSACDICVADPDAKLGSIGVIAQMMTYDRRLEMDGISVHTVRSVPDKQVINPYEKMTDKGLALMDKGVKEIHVEFEKAMSGFRKIDRQVFSDTIATGLEFSAKEALQLGLIDSIMPLEELVKRLAKSKGM